MRCVVGGNFYGYQSIRVVKPIRYSHALNVAGAVHQPLNSGEDEQQVTVKSVNDERRQ
jgi:hypothetical protein